MAGKQKKFKCLYLMKIFLEETDENHGLTLSELNDKLAFYGFDAKWLSKENLYSVPWLPADKVLVDKIAAII